MVLLTSPDYDRIGPKNFLGDPEKGPETPTTRPGSSVSQQRPRGLYIPNEEFRSRYSHYLSSRDTNSSSASMGKGTQQFILMSSIYAQLLVVICVVFFTSEIVTPRVPLFYFEGFYVFLYSVSLLFLLYVYTYLLREPATARTPRRLTLIEGLRMRMGAGGERGPKGPDIETPNPSTCPRAKKHRISENDRSHGSLFLRIGAIAFGLGTMVYNGLEFGSFFEIPSSSPCYSILLGINPVLQMMFTFAQMYFIFANARLNIHKFKVLARFGLMHVVATNICVWIRTVGKETLQEIVKHHLSQERGHPSSLEELILPFRENYIKNNSNPCQKQDIMGSIVSDSSPFLFPFIVEYSLIGAAVLYVMWKNIGKDPVFAELSEDGLSRASSVQTLPKMNCAGSSKGLFFGLLVLVIATICLIVFFVLIENEHYSLLAIFLSDVSHSAIMVLTLFTIGIGFFRIQRLRFQADRTDHLRDILLTVAAYGLYVYAMFGIIAGTLSPKDYVPNLLVMVTSCLTIVQVTLQSLFVAEITCRTTYLPEHDQTKPGRQVVAFLMMGNLTLWIIYTFEMQKAEASPVQLGFYGFMAWTVIVRATLPLSIFYRFHSSITFAEVWKNSYKNVAV
ncbi:proton channel OtopLc [Trichonephila inaurata madagascariensis]|uniref:Proton channel OtopLc n=1 Tax=Trichonephila inaurata madagascariensis TaxID=2747483 RepID=A0A8X7C4G0_9ARAC|nr:proton channel OtopLc [Trichonephila inaurata madagascariensis]